MEEVGKGPLELYHTGRSVKGSPVERHGCCTQELTAAVLRDTEYSRQHSSMDEEGVTRLHPELSSYHQ